MSKAVEEQVAPVKSDKALINFANLANLDVSECWLARTNTPNKGGV